MAFPFLPILLIAGVAMFSSGGGKRGRAVLKRKDKPQVYIPVGVPGPGEVPVFGGICGTHEERVQGVWSAYTKEGECLVFWDADTDETMSYYVRQIFEDGGYSEKDACAPGPGWKGDPFAADPTLQGEWVPNPIQVDIVKKAIAQAYPQIPSDILPPSAAHDASYGDVPYYVEIVWAFTLSIFLRDVCGYIPVT